MQRHGAGSWLLLIPGSVESHRGGIFSTERCSYAPSSIAHRAGQCKALQDLITRHACYFDQYSSPFAPARGLRPRQHYDVRPFPSSPRTSVWFTLARLAPFQSDWYNSLQRAEPFVEYSIPIFSLVLNAVRSHHLQQQRPRSKAAQRPDRGQRDCSDTSAVHRHLIRGCLSSSSVKLTFYFCGPSCQIYFP